MLVERLTDLTLSVQAQSRQVAEAAQRQEEAARVLQLQNAFQVLMGSIRASGPDNAPLWNSQISTTEFYRSLHPIPCRPDLLRTITPPPNLLEGRPTPTDPEVKVVQRWFLSVLGRLFDAPKSEHRAVMAGSTQTPLGVAVGDMRPDAVIVAAADAGRPLADATVPISAIFEIKKGAAASFIAEDMGQALGYGHRLVERRGAARLLVVLANTTHLHLWELVKAPSQPTHVLVLDFGVMSLEVGLGRLAAGLALPSLLCPLGLAASVERVVGIGATSMVFSLAGDQLSGCIAKVVFHETPPSLDQNMADREREVLRALRNVDHVIRRRDEALAEHVVPSLAERTRVLAPRGIEVRPADLLRRPALIGDLVRALQHAHAAGYVHCDLRFSNLYLDGDDALVIADWGFAVKTGDAPRPWHGTVVTASERALLAMASDEQIMPQAADDLEGCVKLARLAVLGRTNAVANVNRAAAYRGYDAVLAFWTWQLDGQPWAHALRHAEHLYYEALANSLVGLLGQPV